MNLKTSVTISIAMIYVCILVPTFDHVSASIQNESQNEAKLTYGQKNEFKKMFDALQEGIIVVDKDRIDFMNTLSDKVLSFLSGLKSFRKNKAHDY